MTPLLAYYVDRLNPFLVQFNERFGIRYYGLAYAFGFLAAAWLLVRYYRAGRSLVSPAQVSDLMVALVMGTVLGGRVGSYLLYDGWRTFGEDPLAIFRVWDGGMSFHGGMVGVVVAFLWFARSQHIPPLHLGDLVASTAPVGLFLGRLANFVNGELWGRVTSVRWAVIFPRSDPGKPIALIAPRHPSQLYEAALEGLLLFGYLQWRLWRTGAVRRHPGAVGGEFLIGYALLRIVGEVFREPDAGLDPILGLSRGTFYSLLMLAAGLAVRLRPARPLSGPPG